MIERMYMPEFLRSLARAGVEFVGHRGYGKMTEEEAGAYVNQCLTDMLNDPFLNIYDEDGVFTFPDIFNYEIVDSRGNGSDDAKKLDGIFSKLDGDQFYGEACIKALPMICLLSKTCSVLAGYYSRFAPVDGQAGMGSFATDLCIALASTMQVYGPEILYTMPGDVVYVGNVKGISTLAKFHPFLVINL